MLFVLPKMWLLFQTVFKNMVHVPTKHRKYCQEMRFDVGSQLPISIFGIADITRRNYRSFSKIRPPKDLHLKSKKGIPHVHPLKTSHVLEVSLRAMAESSTWLLAFAWLPIPIAGPVMFTATLYLNRLGKRRVPERLMTLMVASVTDVDEILIFCKQTHQKCFFGAHFIWFFLREPVLISCHAVFEQQETLQPKARQRLVVQLLAVVFFERVSHRLRQAPSVYYW